MEEDLSIAATDGYPLAATVFSPAAEAAATLIINSAMAVRREFYAPFARAASGRGYATVTYDYRGIGGSRPPRLRGFAARASDWMTLDFEGVMQWTRRELRTSRTFVVGHSFGGNAFGLAPSAPVIDGGVFVAAQSGYWRHWPAPRRYVLGSLWHLVSPTLPRLFGYMPGWTGIGNDVPAGVMLQWSGWCRRPGYASDERTLDAGGYARVGAPLRFLSLADDVGYAPWPAVEALRRIYRAAPTEHVVVQPRAHGLDEVGHFGFFRARARPLWPLALDWLGEHALRPAVAPPPTMEIDR
jgi:predicted alpha/beta hydrolase